MGRPVCYQTYVPNVPWRPAQQGSIVLPHKRKNIFELASMDISALAEWMANVENTLSERQRNIGHEIIKEINKRLGFLMDVGLEYLSLNRSSVSLSGGEGQRIRLATQIGSGLVNVLYILDEPSIGLHERDNIRLINSLKNFVIWEIR